MQKLIETLQQMGIEIPADKQAEVKKALSEHYKNVAEYNKAIAKLETDRDNWKSKAEAAEETLNGLGNLDDLKNVQDELSEWKKKAEDAEKNAQFMRELSAAGRYAVTEKMREQLSDFYGNYASEAECAAKIRSLYESDGYVIDPHTAVASVVYDKYRQETGDGRKTLIVSTASPFKFTRSVMTAIDAKYDAMDDFALVDRLSALNGVPVPAAIEEIRTAPVVHDIQCGRDEMEQAVLDFLK